MSQSQHFNVKIRELKEGNPTAPQSNRFHEGANAARKLCIVWDNGRKMIFYYSYLIAVNLELENDINCLTLQFLAHRVLLMGYNLELLFTHFLFEEPHILYVIPERYAAINEADKFILTEAVIKIEREKKKEKN